MQPTVRSPADLAIAPDLLLTRPLCVTCGAPPPGKVGMHGDGLTHRTVVWPVFDGLVLLFELVRVVGRRFRCPTCPKTQRVGHPGLLRGRYSLAAVAALLHLIAPQGVGGMGCSQEEAYTHVTGKRLSVSERGRTGHPRWTSLLRWMDRLSALWPGKIYFGSKRIEHLQSWVRSFSPGATTKEVVLAAVIAHAQGGAAM